MVEADHPELSIAQQCVILGISRSSYYYQSKKVPKDPDLVVLETILEVLREKPFYGYRRIARELCYLDSTRTQVRRIIKKAGLRAIYPGLQRTIPSRGSMKSLYLLRGINLWLPNQVWASDITYIKLSGGYVYLVTMIDLYSRKILSWRVSNTMDAQFCVSALEEAIALYGVPGIFNTDQGSQFTSDEYIDYLKETGIKISMDGKGRATDNAFIERFFRTLKYDKIYLEIPEDGLALHNCCDEFICYYNNRREHSSINYSVPAELYKTAA